MQHFILKFQFFTRFLLERTTEVITADRARSFGLCPFCTLAQNMGHPVPVTSESSDLIYKVRKTWTHVASILLS